MGAPPFKLPLHKHVAHYTTMRDVFTALDPVGHIILSSTHEAHVDYIIAAVNQHAALRRERDETQSTVESLTMEYSALLRERDELRRDIETVRGIGAAFSREAAMREVEQQVDGLRLATVGMLVAQDATWEEGEHGHDWHLACEAARAALRSSDGGA